MPLADLVAALEKPSMAVPSKSFPGGPEASTCIGIVTGGAGAEIQRAAAKGVDTFITGEGPHWAAIARGGTRRESPARRPLRHGDFRRKGARALTRGKIRLPVAIHRSSHRPVNHPGFSRRWIFRAETFLNPAPASHEP